MMADNESQGPVIRDRRRIDPVTGEVRNPGQPGPQRGPGPAGGQPKPGKHSVSRPGGAATGTGTDKGPGAGEGAAPGPAASGPDQTAVMLAERTADLQRLQAEYANYRKRVERDRLAVREQALANVLQGLLPVLDDIGRAREHGELTGGFKSVAESLEGIVIKLGLTAYGENGDPFDPTLHEALLHSYSADVTEPTCVQILQPGYRVGERIIRPARVAVAEPGGEVADEAAETELASGEPASAGSASPQSANEEPGDTQSAEAAGTAQDDGEPGQVGPAGAGI
jgi:molecular chaperone GrpE